MPLTIDCAFEYNDSESGGDVVEVIEPTYMIEGSQVEALANNLCLRLLSNNNNLTRFQLWFWLSSMVIQLPMVQSGLSGWGGGGLPRSGFGKSC
ncbi:hypothetical protein LIER_03731 [Lithospermum erythrorhizon]|uniref:Uncharacterized protein n=1 Tax=Lithospermum erythrorhizon TaxID=34254 RepID=A0AAV3NUL6_LITER